MLKANYKLINYSLFFLHSKYYEYIIILNLTNDLSRRFISKNHKYKGANIIFEDIYGSLISIGCKGVI